MKKLLWILATYLLWNSAVQAQLKEDIKTLGPDNGSLLIVGGGPVGEDLWETFIKRAGGKERARIVVIPTAGEDSSIAKNGDRTVKKLKELGVQHVTLLHTRDPKEADKESFIAPLKKATAVWFDGGRQWKIADAFLNTRAHQEFKALLDRGGIIGGTSAGASIQADFLLRGDTRGNTTLIGDHTKGLGFVRGVTIDQHLLRRNRQFDLLEVVKQHPELLGIGIDESTAILVQGNVFQVLGTSYVAVYDHQRLSGTIKTPAGDYGTSGPFFFLGKGQQYDMKERKVIASRPANNNPTASTGL